MTDNQIGRLAMRHEGRSWNAYFAAPGSMDDAVLIGSVSMAVVSQSLVLKQRFIELMRDAVAELINAELGARPTWGGPEPAPEHERAGQA